MVDPNSSKFISSLVKSLQMFCHGYMDFEDSIEIIGHINLRIDNRQKLDYIVNEQVSKQGQESTCFHSNSYHSLPPVQHSERGGSRSGDLPLDTSMAMLAGARVQVDLSGPSPVTRSTFSSYPDGFLSPVGNNSQAIDSQPQDTQQTSVVGSSIKDLSWDAQVSMINHSQASDSAASLAGVGQSCSVGGGVDNGRTDTGMAVTSDGDGQQQSVSGLLQDIVIKADPDAIPSPETQGCSLDPEVLVETSALSSSLPAPFPDTPQVFSTASSHMDMWWGAGRREDGQTDTGISRGAPKTSRPAGAARQTAACGTSSRSVELVSQRDCTSVSRSQQISARQGMLNRRHSSHMCAFSKPAYVMSDGQNMRPPSVASCHNVSGSEHSQRVRAMSVVNNSVASFQNTRPMSVMNCMENSLDIKPLSVANFEATSRPLSVVSCVENVHNNPRPMSVASCAAVSQDLSSLSEEGEGGRWSCGQCGKSFRCRELLVLHVQFVHKDSTGFLSPFDTHPPGSGDPHNTAGGSVNSTVTSCAVISSSVSSLMQDTDSLQSSLVSQGLFDEMDTDFFTRETKVDMPCPQTAREQSKSSGAMIKMDLSEDWLQDTQPGNITATNTGAPFSDPTQLLETGEHSPWASNNAFTAGSSAADININTTFPGMAYNPGPSSRMPQFSSPQGMASSPRGASQYNNPGPSSSRVSQFINPGFSHSGAPRMPQFNPAQSMASPSPRGGSHYSSGSMPARSGPGPRTGPRQWPPGAGGSRRSPSTGRRCRHCNKILHCLSTAQFLEHEACCTKEGLGGLSCGQCGRHFASKVALKDHVDSMHTRKGFQCRACGLVFKWRTYVYQHRYKCAAFRVKREPV